MDVLSRLDVLETTLEEMPLTVMLADPVLVVLNQTNQEHTVRQPHQHVIHVPNIWIQEATHVLTVRQDKSQISTTMDVTSHH